MLLGFGSTLWIEKATAKSEFIVIRSAEDWIKFRDMVEAAKGQYSVDARLEADITVDVTIGWGKNYAYSGVFDGNGHILTISTDLGDNEAVAPFRYVGNTTIRDLHVTGNIKGGIHCAGLIGYCIDGSPNVTISRVWISTEVTSTSTHAGGIIGHSNRANIFMNDCRFDGKVTTKSLSGTYAGDIIGWANNGGSWNIKRVYDQGSPYAAQMFYGLWHDGSTWHSWGTNSSSLTVTQHGWTNVDHYNKNDQNEVADIMNGRLSGSWHIVDGKAVPVMGRHWVCLSEGSSSGKRLTTGYYYVTRDVAFKNTSCGNGLTVEPGAVVHIYIPKGVTLTATGGDASGRDGGGAGILLPQGSTLYLEGSGKVVAQGGRAADGGNGSNGNSAYQGSDGIYGGSGGSGGHGGGGAGAGIGTSGAAGGSGGSGSHHNGGSGSWTDVQGVNGKSGGTGGSADAMGTLYVEQTFGLDVTATGGSQGSSGGVGTAGSGAAAHPGANLYIAAGGGGGGGGGFGGAAYGIGTGGCGGGGGGGGAAGNTTYTHYSGTLNKYHHAGAKGGKGGVNGNGSSAPDGGTTELSNPYDAASRADNLRSSRDKYTDDGGWDTSNQWHDGGSAGYRGTPANSQPVDNNHYTLQFNVMSQAGGQVEKTATDSHKSNRSNGTLSVSIPTTHTLGLTATDKYVASWFTNSNCNGSSKASFDEFSIGSGTTNLYGRWNDYSDIFPEGNGTKGNPFIIRNAQLLSLADYVNNGGNTRGVYFRQDGDVNVSDVLTNTGRGSEWTPIGHTRFFEGDYDGGGNLISRATIAVASPHPAENDGSAVGLFGRVTGCIHHLGAEEITVSNSYDGVRGGVIAGVLMRDDRELTVAGSIRHCYAANVTVEAPCAGGLVGEMEQLTSLSYCHESGNSVSGSTSGAFCGTVHEAAKVDMCFTKGGKMFGNNYGHATRCESDVEDSRMAGGEITWLLNDRTASDVTWYQDLADQPHPDAYPVLDSESKRVYSDGIKFSNASMSIFTLAGSGTGDDPYLVGSERDMRLIADYCNSGNSSTGICFLQTADIDMGGAAWTPIGSDAFDGCYDGGGHTISNGSVSGDSVAGVFGTVSGTVSRLCVEHSTFKADGDRARIGAIAGCVRGDGRVTNCLVRNCTIRHDGSDGVAGAVAAELCDQAVVSNCLGYQNTLQASRVGYVCGDTQRATTISRCFTDGNALVGGNAHGTVTNSSANEQYNTLAGGDVCYALNNSTPSPEPVWRQTLERDVTPVLADGHAIVFCQNGNFTNDLLNIDRLGRGTREEPYKIATAKDLQDIVVTIGLMRRSDFYIVQTADIDLQDSLMVPIGTCTPGFEGHYDGGGHVVRNVSMLNYGSSSMGLFNVIVGTVERLGIENSTFRADNKVTRLGAFAGKVTGSGVLRDCFVRGSTVDFNGNAGVVVGGLVGELADNARMESCYGYQNDVVGQNDGRNRFGDVVGNIGSGASASLVFTDGGSLCAEQQSGAKNMTDSERDVDASRFVSGELCWLLGGSKSGDTVWRQTIRTDSLPTPDSRHDMVYRHTLNEQTLYTNATDIPQTVLLTLHANNDDDEVKTVQAFRADDSCYVPDFKFAPYTFEREYYFLAGWNTREDGKGTFYPFNGAMLPTGSQALYADWQMTIPDDEETSEVELSADTLFFRIHDASGPIKPYGTDYDGKLTLVAPEGCVISLTGTVATEALSDGEAVDYMTVYDGDDTSATRLTNARAKSGDGYSDVFFSSSDGVAEDIGRLMSTGRKMTIQFVTDGANNYNGLDLMATVLPEDIRSLGIGTAESPIEVASADDLLTVGEYVRVTGDSKIHVRQTADIDMAGKRFTPIDDTVESFEGVYDGCGHTIGNLKVAGTDASEVGLFRNVSGTVQRLGIVNSTFTGTAGNVGAFAGRLSGNGQLRHCYARDNSVTLAGDGGAAGVLVGQQADASQMVSCYGYHNVVDGQQHAAAIAGEMSGSASQYLVFTDASTSDFTFLGGELCYQLNSVLTDSVVWYQTLGADSLPVLRDSHAVVYRHEFDSDVVYSNSATAETVKLHLVNVFDSNGNKDVDVVKSSYRSLADLTMTHESFVLSGWNTAANGSGTAYEQDGPVMVNDELTLYAQWRLEAEGTEADPYRVATSTHLKNLAEYIYLTGKADFYVRQEADIYLTDVTMKPIGTGVHPFSGTYDGGGFVIRNGVIQSSADNLTAGTFGMVTGKVTRLGVVNMTIEGMNDNARIGAIAGRLSGRGTITYCFVKDCKVTSDKVSVAGAVVADMFDQAAIRSCFTLNNTLKATRTAHICSDTKSGTVISNCYTDGNRLFSEAGANVTDSKPGMNAERFASGEVCWLLNGAQSENAVWRQTLGADDLPVFGERHGTVYHYLNEQTRQEIYSNASAAPETITITLHYNDGSDNKDTILAYRQHSEEESYMAFAFNPVDRINDDGTSAAKWTERADGGGAAYQHGDIIKPYNDMELYAQWGYAIYDRKDFVTYGKKDGNLYLMQDIDLGEWGSAKSFDLWGHFDGCGHTIRYSSLSNSKGLFYTVRDEASVKHLRVETDVATWKDFGGIAYRCWGTVSDCHFRGTVRELDPGDDPELAGIALKVNSKSVVDHCSATGRLISGETVYHISNQNRTNVSCWTWVDPDNHSEYASLREQASSMLAEYPVYAKGILDAVGPEVILGSKTIDAADNHVASLTINDGERFSCPAEVTVDQITYVRRGTNGAYEPWVLPFDYTVDASMLTGGVELYRFVKDSNGNIQTKQISSDKPYQVAANEPLAFRTTGGDKYSFQMKCVKNGSSQPMTIRMPTGGVAASMSSKKDLARVVATYDNIAADKAKENLMYIWDNDMGDFVLGDGNTGLQPFRYYLQYVDKATSNLEEYEQTDWARREAREKAASQKALPRKRAAQRTRLTTMTAEGWQPVILDPRGSQEVTSKMLDDYEILGLYDLYDAADETDESRMAVTAIYESVVEGMTLPTAVPLLVRAKRADAEPLVSEQMGRDIDELLTEAAKNMTEDEVTEAFEDTHYWCSTFAGRYDVWQFAMPEKDALLNGYGALVFGDTGDDQFFYRVAASDGTTMKPMSYCFTAYDARTFQNLPLANDRIGIVVLDFDGEATGIETVGSRLTRSNGDAYNLNGQKVGYGYRGIVIQNGRKVFKAE